MALKRIKLFKQNKQANQTILQHKQYSYDRHQHRSQKHSVEWLFGSARPNKKGKWKGGGGHFWCVLMHKVVMEQLEGQ